MIYHDKAHLIQSKVHPDDTVLDVGFSGQGLEVHDPEWVHGLLKKQSHNVYGVDLDFDREVFDESHYIVGSAEDFSFGRTFDVIFAGDLIEHLSNPGLFLSAAAQHATLSTRLILTTPNCFNLFNIAEKFTKVEPTVNADHTCYFNEPTLRRLLKKNGWEVESVDYVFTLNPKFKQSWKKKFLNILYKLASVKTPKFIETLVITATYRQAEVFPKKS